MMIRGLHERSAPVTLARPSVRTMRIVLLTLALSTGLCRNPSSVGAQTGGPALEHYRKAKMALEMGDVDGFTRERSILERAADDPHSACLSELLDGFWAVGAQNYTGAIRTLEPVTQCAQTLFGERSALHLEALTFLSWAYGYAGDLDSELRINQDLLAHYRSDSGRYATEIADTYNTIAMNLGMRGDRVSEMRMLQEGLALLDTQEPVDAEEDLRLKSIRWTLLNSYALSAVNAGQYANARIAAHRCIELLHALDPSSTRQAISEQVVARAWWMIEGDIDSCLAYMDRALTRLERNERSDQPGRGSATWLSYASYKADFQLQAGRAQDALATCNDAAPFLAPELFEVPAVREGALKLSLTRTRALLVLGRTDEALAASGSLGRILHHPLLQRDLLVLQWAGVHLKALEVAGDITSASRLADSIITHYRLLDPSLKRPPSTFNTAFVEALVQFGLLHLRHGRTTRALECLRTAADMHLENQQSFFATGAEDLSAAERNDPVEALLEALAHQPSTEAAAIEAANVLARTKGALLLQHQREEQLLSGLLGPKEEAERLRLRSRIFSANSDYLNEPGPAQTDSLLRANARYSAFMAGLRKRFPVLDRRIELTGDCDLRRIADREQAVVLDQYMGRDALFTVCATRDHIRLERREGREALLSGLARARGTSLSAEAWARTSPEPDDAWRLSARQILVDGLVPPGTDRLIVIPHRELFLLNYEMLPGLHDPERFLIEDLAVHYALGASLLCRPETADPRDHMLAVGAFSASAFDALPAEDALLAEARARGGLFDLDGVVREAELVADLLGGEHIPHATARDLLTRAHEFDVLHIGTHGFALQNGTGNSFLLFEGRNGPTDRVTRAQVAGLDLHSRLVVLSACNTGVGPLRGGEGVASLARSFIQAGSRAVVSSLWPVPDEGTSGLMTAFYQNLHQGMGRSEALRQAKLDHLRAHPDGALRQPYHWAGFVLYGDAGPLYPVPWTRRVPWWAIAGIVLVVTVLLYRRSRSSAARG